MSAWYYAKNSRQYGPIAFDALRKLAVDGLLSSTDLVWHEDLSDWQPAGQISGLFQATPATKSAPPFPTRAMPTPAMIASTALPADHPPARPNVGPSQENLAVAALVLGCASFVFFGPVLGIPGLICGKIALRNMRIYGNDTGKGMAQAGVIIGYIWCGFIALILLAVILFIVFMIVAAGAAG